jgi:hypothetical protein
VIFFKKKRITVYVTWRDQKGKEVTKKLDMFTWRKKNMIVLWGNGAQFQVRVEL